MRFVFHLRLTGSLNSREHWAARAKRVKRERMATASAWRALAFVQQVPRLPFVVTLTRIAPRPLDSDNLAGRLKGVRDQVAFQLGVDDGAEGVTWRYEQRRGAPRAHGVEVSVLPKAQWLAGEIAALAADACSTRSTGAPHDEPTQNEAKVRRGRRVAPKPSQRPRP